VEHSGHKFEIKFGEFSAYLKSMNYYLERAVQYAANDNQRDMVRLYIEHYNTGSIETHKDSQRKWIADQGPVVETNMGWIETYIDPENTRAYFEGLVAIVDKDLSKKFKQLVTNSEHSCLGRDAWKKIRSWLQISQPWMSSAWLPILVPWASTFQTTMTFVRMRASRMST
jgi:hypothetical protein